MIPSPTPHLVGTRIKPTPEERNTILETLHVQQAELRKANSQVIAAETLLNRLNKEWDCMIQYVLEDTCAAKLRNAIVQVVGEIDEAQRTLTRTITIRNEIQRFVDSHSAIITPLAQWLLQDVLGEVFLTLVNDIPYNSSSHKRGAMAISQVCRHWRNVAFSTPLLWNSFADFKLRLQFTEFWLGNSGSSPLTLSLLPCEKLDQNLLSLFTSYRARWKHFSISLPIFLLSTLPAVPHETPNDVGWLESLNVDVVPSRKDLEYHTAESFQWLSSIAQVAPRLTRISWTGPVVVKGIVWSQLTHIKLATTTVTVALSVLTEATNVQHFTAGLSTEDIESDTVTSSYIRLPHLTRLDIMFYRVQPFHVNTFFSPLDLPSLREFYISSPSWWPQEEISNLLNRPGCNPQELHIYECRGMQCQNIIQLIRHPALAKCIIKLDVSWCSRPPPPRALALNNMHMHMNVHMNMNPMNPVNPVYIIQNHREQYTPSPRLLPSGLRTINFHGRQVPANHPGKRLTKTKLRHGSEEFPVYLDMSMRNTAPSQYRHNWPVFELSMTEPDGILTFECM